MPKIGKSEGKSEKEINIVEKIECEILKKCPSKEDGELEKIKNKISSSFPSSPSRLRRERLAQQDDPPAQHVHRHPILDGPGGHSLRREPGRDLRQPQRPLVPGDLGPRDGRGPAAALRHAPDEGAVPHSEEPAAEAQEPEEVVEKVPQVSCWFRVSSFELSDF